MSIVWGTSHFVSMWAAQRYYRPYYHDDWKAAAFAVADKVRRGEIHIGKPPLKPGEHLVLIDERTRYGVRTS